MRRTTVIGALLTAASFVLCLVVLSCATNEPTTTAAAKPDPVALPRFS